MVNRYFYTVSVAPSHHKTPVEDQAFIAGSVPVGRLVKALAAAGLVARHDQSRNALVIELYQGVRQ
jgi:hypothetical protein